MKCPKCQADTNVIDSRRRANNFIRRRRKCSHCSNSFITTEVMGDAGSNNMPLFRPIVAKKSGNTEYYDSDKLSKSILVALRKSQREDMPIKQIISEIESEIHSLGDVSGHINTKNIGEKVMAILRQHDTVAYLRYASVHREMETPEDFRALLDELSLPPPRDD